MESKKIEFHKIWVEQCDATDGIKERFGLQNALAYLIGEKLFGFVQAAETRPEFAAELPDFLKEIRRIFTPLQISGYLGYLERTRFLPPPEPEPVYDLGIKEEFEEDEGDDLENPVMGAEELLRFARIKAMLLAGG
jgi:hypothetical protein